MIWIEPDCLLHLVDCLFRLADEDEEITHFREKLRVARFWHKADVRAESHERLLLAQSGRWRPHFIPVLRASTKLPPPRPLKGALMRRREAGRGAVSRGSGFASPALGRRRGSARVH